MDTDIKPGDFRHRLPLQTRFNDTDMFGHINNSVYLQFMDMGKYAYLRQFMKGDFAAGDTAAVVANINCNFYRPSFMDEKLSVLTTCTRIGDSSFTLLQCVVDSHDNVKCSATTTMVNINRTTGQPVTVDSEWRRLIGEYEGRAFDLVNKG
ncbi:MAG: acyl-CoA thioesterase [Muribaculaceae bacterium]|nr:acyl-CoA thioesterase [Muribaculaceae bacterium]